MTKFQRNPVTNQRPNILLITTDTQRCDTLACMGSEFAQSPHLDRLASEGVLFRDAYTTCPVCMPARSTLVTGTYPQTHGAIENGLDRKEHLVTYPELLKEAGYTTIMAGKAHFGPIPAAFDVQRITNGEKGADVRDIYADFLKEHGYQRGAVGTTPLPDELHMDSFLVDQTIDAIDQVRDTGAGPFFAHCSLLSPHAPIDPPGNWRNLYDDTTLPTANYREGELAEMPAHIREVLGLARQTDRSRYFPDGETLDAAAVDRLRRDYYGLAGFCDALVGRLLDYLDSTGLRESTLVIFTSDHGTQLFDHGFDNKHNFYDASWRVPFMLSMPGTIPMGQVADFASWVDLAPTILGAAGTRCPTMQGFDLFTPLRDDQPLPRRCATASLYRATALVTDHWKLEYYVEESGGRLFDRHEDPEEQIDLYHRAEYRSVRDSLLTALLSWHADVVDVQWLQEHTHGGGPIAKITAEHTRSLLGNAADERLGARIGELAMHVDASG